MQTSQIKKVGIVGLGFMAATHIKAYRQVPSLAIGAICNPSGRNLDGDFSKVGGNIAVGDPVILDMSRVKAFRNYDEMLNDPEIEIIDICSPTQAHPELAIAAFKAGKHVICEKPLARTSPLGQKIVDAARASGKILMPAMCLRFWPEWAWLKAAISDGRYGKVLAARFRRVAEPPGWGHKHFVDGALSGGALLDLHIHDTDFVQYCFGFPKSVYSTGYTKFSGAIDHVVTQYQVAGGTIVQAEGGWAMTPGFGFNMSYTANFERATVDYDIARGADALRICAEGEAPRFLKLDQPDGYVGEMAHLAECIFGNKQPSVVSPEDGMNAVRICEAEEESIRTGQVVQLH